jgi:hypothetical protein
LNSLLIIFLLVGLASAQQVALPEAPSHSFFDVGNMVRVIALGGLLTADGITTQNLIQVQHDGETNPLARPLVMSGTGGQSGACAIGFGVTVETAYLFHKMGHHKLERVTLYFANGLETGAVASNVSLRYQ